MSTVLLCPLFLSPVFLCVHCSFFVPVSTVCLEYAFSSSVSFHPLCLFFRCAFSSSISTIPLCQSLLLHLLFLDVHCSPVPSLPLCLMFLCVFRFSVLSLPLCLLFLCAFSSFVPSVPRCPLFLCPLCSFVSSFPLNLSCFLCAFCSFVPSFPLCLLFHCAFSSSVCSVPSCMRLQVLEKICEGHQGITKCREPASGGGGQISVIKYKTWLTIAS